MNLSIKSFQKGKTSSPYTADGAFWKSANLDIHGQSGIARINYKPTAHTGTGTGEIEGIITSFASLSGIGGLGVFADQNHPVKRITAPTTTTIVGDAAFNAYYVANWKGYVLAIGTTTMKATPINAGMNGSWTSMSTSFENMSLHKILSSLKDGKVYIANKNKVAKLEQVAGQTFDPANAGTFTLTLDALVLDSGWQVESIEEFGRFLALFVDITGENKTAILLWDRSALTVDDMFEIRELKMTRTLEHQGKIYITGGNQGNIYELSESGLKKYAQINIGDYDNQNYIQSGGDLSYLTLQFQTMAMWKDRLMVGVSVVGTSEPAGIYSIKDGIVNQEFICSNGITDTDLTIGSMTTFGDYLFYGWRTGSPATYGFDSVRDDANRLTGYICYFETPFLRVGYKLEKNNVDRIEVILARPLQTGEGIILRYRKNINDSWTLLGTKDYTTNGALSSFIFPAITNIENLQIRCEMTTGATSKNTPYLQEIILV